ncbi:hypothetical protein B0H17DRAFT_1203461 [Mycena rosella]|uniref:Uncharacterized protein n=1 Tax=Mycena rosella TaxID=1033263 RepID=A0AAD7GH22_MYCRO|nr:hypothetical protein B0H17DRAFT_1203461 [Mycena rosella]
MTNGAEIPRLVAKIAPNQGTWNDTAEVMDVKRKSSKKRKNTDTYCGGESSGKLAHPDGRAAKKEKITPSPLPPINDAQREFDGFYDPELLAPDVFAFTTESPETLLRTALALYNNMFPPADIPQRTSYYHENTYVPTIQGPHCC